MRPEAKLDLRSFNDSIRLLKSVNRRDNTVFLRRIGKELLKYLVQLTPPSAGHALTERAGAQLKAGRQAIENDLRQSFKSIKTLQITEDQNSRLGKGFRAMIRRGQYEEASALARKAGLRIAGFVDRLEGSLHRKLRTKRGRTQRVIPWVIANHASIGERIRKVQKRVGYAKAGWKASADKLKYHLPQWVSRHNAPGSYRESGVLSPRFTITMHNRIRNGIRIYSSIVPEALRRIHGSVKAQYTAIINKRHKAKVRSGANFQNN